MSSAFSKFIIMSLQFTKDLYQCLFLLIKKKKNRIFTFIRKGESENSILHLFHRSFYRVPCSAPLPRPHQIIPRAALGP